MSSLTQNGSSTSRLILWALCKADTESELPISRLIYGTKNALVYSDLIHSLSLYTYSPYYGSHHSSDHILLHYFVLHCTPSIDTLGYIVVRHCLAPLYEVCPSMLAQGVFKQKSPHNRQATSSDRAGSARNKRQVNVKMDSQI